MSSIKIDIVSTIGEIFSGLGKFISIPSMNGDIGVLPGHTPLISLIRPGTVKIVLLDDVEERIVICGGILEVQPYFVTILTDTAIRARDSDEAKAMLAREKAKIASMNAKNKSTVAAVEAELAMLTVQTKVNYKKKF